MQNELLVVSGADRAGIRELLIVAVIRRHTATRCYSPSARQERCEGEIGTVS